MKYYKDENNQVYAYEDNIPEFGSYVEVEKIAGGEPILDEDGQIILDENGNQLTTEKSIVIEKVYNELTVKEGLISITKKQADKLIKPVLTAEEIIAYNQSLKNGLLSEAVNQISLLQDAIDCEIQEDGDEERLKEWKKYRVLLNRATVTAEVVDWPEKPTK